MYYAITEGKKLATERLRWIKQQDNSVFVHCNEDEGQGIIIDGEIYHISGRAKIDKPTADIIWEDDTKKLIDAISLGSGGNRNPKATLEGSIRFAKILFKQSLPDLTPDEILVFDSLLDDWAPSTYEVNDVRNRDGQVWRCCQAHSSNAEESAIIPGEEEGSEFWTPYHAKSVENARPWVKPNTTRNKYKKGEYVTHRDGGKYRCKSDTESSPTESAKSWEEVE